MWLLINPTKAKSDTVLICMFPTKYLGVILEAIIMSQTDDWTSSVYLWTGKKLINMEDDAGFSWMIRR